MSCRKGSIYESEDDEHRDPHGGAGGKWTRPVRGAGEGALVIRNATGVESFVCDGDCEGCPFVADDCDGNCADCPCQSACDRVNEKGIDE